MSDTQDLVLTDAQISAIYAELATLHVDLDDDPLLYGPKRLNGKIAETRKLLTRCEQFFLELNRRLHGCQREHRKHTALLDMQKQDMLANDPDVRSGRNIADRDAIAAIKLRPQIEAVHKLEAATTDLTTVLVVVKAKRLDLKDLQNRLKDQIKVCQDEIGLGGRWGSARPANATTVLPEPGQLGSEPPRAGASDEISDMFAQIDAELARPQPEPEPAPAETGLALDLDAIDAAVWVSENFGAEPVDQEPEVPAPVSVETVLVSSAPQADVDSALDDLIVEEPRQTGFDDMGLDLILG